MPLTRISIHCAFSQNDKNPLESNSEAFGRLCNGKNKDLVRIRGPYSMRKGASTCVGPGPAYEKSCELLGMDN